RHLIFFAPDYNPCEDFIESTYPSARALLASIYDLLGYLCEAGTWRNIYLVGASELRRGGLLGNVSGKAVNPEILCAVDDGLLFDFMASRINPVGNFNTKIEALIVQTDRQSSFILDYNNGTLNFHQDTDDTGCRSAGIKLVLGREPLVKLIMKSATVAQLVCSRLSSVISPAGENHSDSIDYLQTLFDLIPVTDQEESQIVLPWGYKTTTV
ncbi:MAG: hypothetical protein LBV33_05575, partial [Lachnospiraceae bacterium]|nr:hypothetical protein [Lachnospiraceae bacterium]